MQGLLLVGKLLELYAYSKKDILQLIPMTLILLKLSLFFLEPILAIITQTWVKPIATGNTKPRKLDQCCVTANSLRDGIVLWEEQEQKCLHLVCQHTDVAQTGQAG